MCPNFPDSQSLTISMSRLQSTDFEALADLRYLGRKFLRFSKDLLRTKVGLNPEQYEALLAIKAYGPGKGLIIAELSERLQVRHHSAVNIVDRLAERKLVTRAAGETDRRKRHVQLTPKGEDLIAELAALHYKEWRSRSTEMIHALERLRK
jgi:DNA-binding MarR family transcriptional regulator